MSDASASLFDDLLGMVDPTLHHRSGAVLYSGRTAFAGLAKLYLLGLNPGGDPDKQRDKTIARNIESLRQRESWSAYADDSWRKRPPGKYGMQPRVLHLLRRLRLDPRSVPASNVVFVRSAREAELDREKSQLLPLCWKVHAEVIERLDVHVVVCFGRTAGSWVRKQLHAHDEVDTFEEKNQRRWRSHAHASRDGRRVVTLTHPGIADWTRSNSDPTPLVERALAATGNHLDTCRPRLAMRRS